MYSWRIIHGKHKRMALQSLIKSMNKTQTTAGIGCYHLLPFCNDITGNLHESSYKGDCDAKHRLRRGKMSKITNLPTHAHQMSTSPSLPPDLEILDSATSNHPHPLSRIGLLMENVNFFGISDSAVSNHAPPPNPTPNFEHFFNFRFGYLKSPPTH